MRLNSLHVPCMRKTTSCVGHVEPYRTVPCLLVFGLPRVSDVDFGLGIGSKLKLVKSASTHVYPDKCHEAGDGEPRSTIGGDAGDNVGPSVEDVAVSPSDPNKCGHGCT